LVESRDLSGDSLHIPARRRSLEEEIIHRSYSGSGNVCAGTRRSIVSYKDYRIAIDPSEIYPIANDGRPRSNTESARAPSRRYLSRNRCGVPASRTYTNG